MSRVRRNGIVVVLAVVILAVPTMAAYASWNRTVTAQVSISVAAPAGPAAPTGLTCVSDSRAKAVTLSWATVAGVTYTVRRLSDGALVGPSAAFPGVTLNANSTNMSNNVDLIIRASTSSVSTDSTKYFAVQLAAGTCTVTP